MVTGDEVSLAFHRNSSHRWAALQQRLDSCTASLFLSTTTTKPDPSAPQPHPNRIPINMVNLSSTAPPRNTLGPADQHQLEEWGAHCSLPSCNMLDFLPLKCPECEQLYCSSHFKPSLISSDSNHLCEKLIMNSKNAESTNKSTLTSKMNQSGTKNKKCSYAKCKTIMFSPITCRNCQLSYCPTHRLEQDHLCKPSSTTSASAPSSTRPIHSQRNKSRYPNLMKNYLGQKSFDQKSDSSATPQAQSHDHKIDLSSTSLLKQTLSKIQANQRSKSELESKQKALEFRIRNGLLTETDKIELQKLEEKHQKHEISSVSNSNKFATTTAINKSNNQSDCCIV